MTSPRTHIHRIFTLLFAWSAATIPQAVLAGPGTQVSVSRSGASPITTSSQRIDRDGTIRSLYNVRDRARAGAPEQAAREFFADRHLVAPGSGELIAAGTAASNTGYHVRFEQYFAGLPVHGGSVTVSMTLGREITMVVNNTVPAIRLSMPASVLAPEEAMERARRAVNADDSPAGVEDAARLMVYRGSDGKDHVAYRVTVVRGAGSAATGDWEIFVEASGGAVLGLQDQFVHSGPTIRGHGFAYRSDPLSAARQKYGSRGFTDQNDATSDSLDAYRVPVDLDSLEVLDGSVWLRGPFCEITDIEAPADSAYGMPTPDGFFFDRSRPEFEAVNAYYHAGLVAARLRELGFALPALRLRIDPHGCGGRDDSHYSPTGHWIAFGTGGVDDAEDADVLWHEIGHALQYSMIPGWGGGECGALGEGFADYWAASYSRSLGEWQPSDPEYHWLFNWDGHNPFWSGRITNDGRSYPFGSMGIHEAGQIWSSALVGILGDLGREVTDRLVLHSFSYLGPGITASDNAQAIVQADRDLYGGRHLPTLFYWLSTLKGFIPRTVEPGILVINDDPEGTNARKSEKGTIDAGCICSAVAMISAVDATAAQLTTFASLDTSRLSAFSLVILSGGLNPRPFDDPVKRAALVRYAQNGGRIVVEGGEVGYFYRKDQEDRDPEFREHVLHAVSFVSDVPDADLICGTGGMFAEPNVLPVSIRFAPRSGFADRDAMTPATSTPGTISLGGWSGTPSAAGIIAHVTPERTVNTVFLPFAVSSIGDSAVGAALIQNVLAFVFSSVATGVEEISAPVPFGYGLEQNYPNPFNSSSDISYQISDIGMTKLTVYDILGREVVTLVNERKAPGKYTVRFTAEGVSSGTYLYSLEVGGTRLVRKMVLTR
jgi:hypothetical protein